MKRLLPIVVAIATLTGTATAQAHLVVENQSRVSVRTADRPSSDELLAAPLANLPRLAEDLQVAQNFYGASPQVDKDCPTGVPTVRVIALAEKTMGIGERPGCKIWVSAEAQDVALNSAAHADPGVSVAEAAQTAAAMICNLIVHEYGHNLGYEHSGDPSNIMYPTLTLVVGSCPLPAPGVAYRMKEGHVRFFKPPFKGSISPDSALEQEDSEEAETAPSKALKCADVRVKTKTGYRVRILCGRELKAHRDAQRAAKLKAQRKKAKNKAKKASTRAARRA